MRDGLVVRNVAKLVERPSQPKREMNSAHAHVHSIGPTTLERALVAALAPEGIGKGITAIWWWTI